MKKYDVAIYGLWYGNNYGSIITYYALSKVVESMGLTYAMIRNPLGREINIDELDRSHPLRFAKEKYEITPLLPLNKLSELNESFDTFLLGSDQMWNYNLSKPYKQSYFFDFVADDKRKVSYATSFGKDTYIGPADEKILTEKNLKRFDAISVRDDFSKRICENNFDVRAELVLDPVFLCPVDEYEKLIEEATDFNIDEDYIFSYILDPNPKIGKSIQKISEETGKKVVVVFNQTGDMEALRKRLEITSDRVEFRYSVTVKEWLYLYKNALYVLTDSFHGTCFSIIFKKKFISMRNNGRGGSRFPFLLGTFGLMDYMIEKPEQFIEKFHEYGLNSNVDYISVGKILEKERARCYDWLKNVLTAAPQFKDIKLLKEKKNMVGSEIEKLHSNIEFKKIKTIAELIYSYDIKHVVLSPGGRDVPLVRMFEYNDDLFKVHHVVDERSAAYYGLGLATQLKQPVVCVCTSGTAASNYLPAVTEAYYTGIPLIMITADRLTVYHEQGEDQTIPQSHIYDNVIKKSITIPETSGPRTDRQIIRDVCDCILETTHHTPGPVHINIAIDNITIGSNLGREAWRISKKLNFNRILRVSSDDSFKVQKRWIDSLKRSKRILLVYGQNNPLTEKQKSDVEAFARKYNCVILTDLISNYDGEYCLKPYNMLSSMSNEQFNNLLSPDILITVGGKRLMNDPLTMKIRRGLSNVRHWGVNPDGKVKDFYFKESSVLEMSQDYFFRFFAENAGDIQNDREYYRLWKNECEKFPTPVEKNFNSLYVQSSFLPSIPENSILHLGVGLSFYSSRRYEIDNTVEVYCNMGTNGIDGCTSTFLGQTAVADKEKLCFLIVGDLSFFYDMNSLWDKKFNPNTRILLVNNNGSGLLKGHKLKNITSVHNTKAKGWVESTGIKYISADNKDDFKEKLKYFVSKDAGEALFFEVFCD